MLSVSRIGAVGGGNEVRIDGPPLGVISELGEDNTDDEADMLEGEPGFELPDNPRWCPL